MPSLRFTTFLAPTLLPVYEAVVEAVGAALGVPTELTVGGDYEECSQRNHDACFVCSLPYVTLERDGTGHASPVAAPVLRGERYGGRPIYFSDVIVRRDSLIGAFGDLRDRTWAYNEPLSQSGYGITRHHLIGMGATHGFFGEVVAAGFHARAIELVRSSQVDGSAIDSQVLAVAMREDPSLQDDLRVIGALGPSPIQPLLVADDLDADVRSAIRDAVVAMNTDERFASALSHGLVNRFVAVGPEHYDPIRRMVDECEAAGFVEIR